MHSPAEINLCFAEFYQALYSSRVGYREEDLTRYLADVDLPVLTSTYRDRLDSPITVKEILQALKSMQPDKTPGPDGIPVEF